MSRMVRESEISGLRERLFFARSLLKTLNLDEDGPVGPRLALRGGVVFHLYSVLVGIARQAARSYQVSGYEDLISLAALEQAFAAAGVQAPEMNLLAQARANRSDPVFWLDQEMRAAVGAAGLARRPAAPEERDALAIRAEDPYVPLASGDRQRLEQAATRVEELVTLCSGYMEEW
ncbi:hypothetical protein [Alloalcanivorax gelatiniphagus]|uniref:HEPN domain-containing protein n=1 Tax=Alloalcanivorax gelatiniphagus TaxID=1194167 RepID=A0ABY2XQR1_9GAMM|nr:hypothetical protein [Alloalcanivorax gelatiniphagus]TMW14391.1 hypothetical protein FGS76_03495 [Alloalcanivorax gelatiniphagus]